MKLVHGRYLIIVENLKKFKSLPLILHLSLHRKKVDNFESELFCSNMVKRQIKILKIPKQGSRLRKKQY